MSGPALPPAGLGLVPPEGATIPAPSPPATPRALAQPAQAPAPGPRPSSWHGHQPTHPLANPPACLPLLLLPAGAYASVPPKLRLADPDAYAAQLAAKQQRMELKRQQLVLDKMVGGGAPWPAGLPGRLPACLPGAGWMEAGMDAGPLLCCFSCP